MQNVLIDIKINLSHDEFSEDIVFLEIRRKCDRPEFFDSLKKIVEELEGPILQEVSHCIGLLAYTSDEIIIKSLLKSGMPELVIKIMKKMPDNGPINSYSCFALANILSNRPNHIDIIINEEKEFLTNQFNHHRRDKDCITDITFLLSILFDSKNFHPYQIIGVDMIEAIVEGIKEFNDPNFLEDSFNVLGTITDYKEINPEQNVNECINYLSEKNFYTDCIKILEEESLPLSIEVNVFNCVANALSFDSKKVENVGFNFMIRISPKKKDLNNI